LLLYCRWFFLLLFLLLLFLLFFTVAEVTEIIKSHKSDRAPGVDGVHSEMLKHASAAFLQEFTSVLNEILESGEVPPALLTGKLTRRSLCWW